jgi:SAM-dependent methyltransferase
MPILEKVRNRIRKVRGHLADYPLIDTGAPPPPAQEIFSKAYDTYQWGSQESRSGEGSELAATENLRAYLPELFERLNVRTFLDAPCGDWNWMRHVDLAGVDYIGADVAPRIVEENSARHARPGVRFMVADLATASLPRADLILCRDCWIHLSFEDIAAILENFKKSGAEWLLVSHTPSQAENRNKRTGLRWRHLNLERPPFNFPPPRESRKDHYPHVPFQIALWNLQDLPRIEA